VGKLEHKKRSVGGRRKESVWRERVGRFFGERAGLSWDEKEYLKLAYIIGGKKDAQREEGGGELCGSLTEETRQCFGSSGHCSKRLQLNEKKAKAAGGEYEKGTRGPTLGKTREQTRRLAGFSFLPAGRDGGISKRQQKGGGGEKKRRESKEKKKTPKKKKNQQMQTK